MDSKTAASENFRDLLTKEYDYQLKSTKVHVLEYPIWATLNFLMEIK